MSHAKKRVTKDTKRPRGKTSEPTSGENRIRTCEPVLPVTRFPGVPLQPLEHLSKFATAKLQIIIELQKLFLHFH